MFFIMGIYDRSKEIEYKGDMVICPACGRYCSYKIYVTYMCLSIFFIPVFRWGKRYYVISTCCGKRYELDRGKGRQAEKGEKVAITEPDLNSAERTN